MSLNTKGMSQLINKLSKDFLLLSYGYNVENLQYEIEDSCENEDIERNARRAALQEINKPSIVKVAFDTRRIDQETERNPRANLQYWNRSQEFIDDDDQDKIKIFSKLMNSLEEIKKEYGTQPEYFDSYARILYDSVNRILRIKQADTDIFRPQLAYLEQLLYARYRLSVSDINKQADADIKKQILKKDENLLKKGIYLNSTGGNSNEIILKDGNVTQQSIVNAIFGSNLRKPGEKSVKRTITITIDESSNDE